MSEEKQHLSVAIAGHVDSGKCQGRDTPILMYDGTIKPIQDVQIEDLVMGDDSTPRKVLGTTKGFGQMYRVTSDDGASYTVNQHHKLSLKNSTKNIPVDISVLEYLNLSEAQKSDLLGYKVGITFPESKVETDPYTLGEYTRTSNDYQNYNVHIPHNYKCNSSENQWSVLLGFMNKDPMGVDYLDFKLKFHSKLRVLRDDLLFIARSLGLYTTIKDIGNDLSLIEIKHKSHEKNLVTGIKIEPIGEDEYFGFSLDGNHRYLMGDFTVTHNSTTTGRLIFELGGINERDMQKLKDEADALGKGSFAFAFYMDRQKDERERGVTISVTTKEFFTPTKHYTILDCPGHRDFIKNMITGSSQADVGVLMVPADGNFTTAVAKGDHKKNEVQGQTRQHGLLFNLLGVKQLIVCVNKMDCDVAKYGEERFNECKNEAFNMLLKVGWKKDFLKNTPFLPISGWKGDNLLTKSENMGWWKGVDVKVDDQTIHIDTLVDALEKMVTVPERPTGKNMRVPISGVYKIKGVGDVLTGRVEQGVVETGKEVIFLPTHTQSTACQGKIFSIEMHHRNVPKANPGDNVGLNIKNLNKSNMPQVGDVMIYKDDDTVKSCASFVAQVQVLAHPGELKVGYTPVAFVRTGRSACRMTSINWKMGKSTGGQKVENPPSVKTGDIAEVVFEPQQPFVVEPFKKCEGLGRVAIMEGNGVIMLGKAVKVQFK